MLQFKTGALISGTIVEVWPSGALRPGCNATARLPATTRGLEVRTGRLEQSLRELHICRACHLTGSGLS